MAHRYPAPHVRDTSRAAYHQILHDGMLSRSRRRVYQWLYHHGPATGRLVERDAGYRHANKRLPELRDRLVVREVGRATCPVSGKVAIWWDVTSKLPVEPKRYHEYRVLLRVRPKQDPWGTAKHLHRQLRRDLRGVQVAATLDVTLRTVRRTVGTVL